jgi:hypothetical protein
MIKRLSVLALALALLAGFDWTTPKPAHAATFEQTLANSSTLRLADGMYWLTDKQAMYATAAAGEVGTFGLSACGTSLYNYLCLWQDIGYSGSLVAYRDPGTAYRNFDSGLNNAASSLKNNTGESVRIWDGWGCNGNSWWFGSGAASSDLRWNLANDKLSCFSSG